MCDVFLGFFVSYVYSLSLNICSSLDINTEFNVVAFIRSEEYMVLVAITNLFFFCFIKCLQLFPQNNSALCWCNYQTSLFL